MERGKFDPLLVKTLPEICKVAQKYRAKYHYPQDCRDLIQTVLLKMLRFADLYDPTRGDILPWACVIITNTIKTHLAQAVKTQDMGELIHQIKASNNYNPENDIQLANIIANLNKETRLYIEGYNYSEIASRCGLKSKSTVKIRIDNCTKRIAVLMGVTAERGRRSHTHVKTPVAVTV